MDRCLGSQVVNMSRGLILGQVSCQPATKKHRPNAGAVWVATALNDLQSNALSGAQWSNAWLVHSSLVANIHKVLIWSGNHNFKQHSPVGSSRLCGDQGREGFNSSLSPLSLPLLPFLLSPSLPHTSHTHDPTMTDPLDAGVGLRSQPCHSLMRVAWRKVGGSTSCSVLRPSW